jgi:hypothetical protein
MTSAMDILLDVFAPALDHRRFSTGLFVLCRYSLRPFAFGLLATGISGWLFPFESGDCRDYRTWLRADRGTKDEQTEIHESSRRAIRRLLGHGANEMTTWRQWERRGNIMYPRRTASELARPEGAVM